MKKIILFSLYCAPLFSGELLTNRDRFYVDGYRRAAFEGGIVFGLVVSKGLMSTISGDHLTLADISAAGSLCAALGDLALNYPSADEGVVFGRDAFKELHEPDTTKEYFACGFAAATFGLPVLKIMERRTITGVPTSPTAGELLSIVSGVPAIYYIYKMRMEAVQKAYAALEELD
jgi:hypothetical protein